MATNLIDLLSEDFEPTKYEDRYRAALMEMIEAKLEGQPIKQAKHKTAQGDVVDLLEALKNSVSNVKSGGKRASSKNANEEEENVVQISGAKKTASGKAAPKSAARSQKASGIGRLAKSRTKAAATKKTAKTGAKAKSKKRSA